MGGAMKRKPMCNGLFFKGGIVFLLCILSASCSYLGSPISALHSKWKELMGDQEEMLASSGFAEDLEEEFIALKEDDLQGKFAETAIPQPKEIPGMPGSHLPSLDQFKKATAELAKIFQNVYFNTDDYALRRSEYLHIINSIADYMKRNSKIYISVGGHCDERGSEAYNLALGTRRSNSVRALLIQRGVDSHRIHSISFGKEHPVDLRHNATAWSHNRRVEFKIYKKS